MICRETPLTFDCQGETLIGILHEAPAVSRRGVLIVVGGPQYRAGSHRQFVLLARTLASAGLPTLRFDYRGMGDSTGPFRGFEHINDDIAAAIDAFRAHLPYVEEVVIWGLCDAASAALFYAHRDPRIRGLILVNPWARTASGEAKTYLKHYYTARLLERDFWRKLASGRFDVRESLRSLKDMLRRAALGRATRLGSGDHSNTIEDCDGRPLPERMAEGMRRFAGPVLLIMSGNDFTAREFDEATGKSTVWRDLLASSRIERRDLDEADHTFSRRAWLDQVGTWSIDWLQNLDDLPLGQ